MNEYLLLATQLHSQDVMNSIPKDVKLYIYRLIHKSQMKEIVREYRSSYYLCKDRNFLCKKNIDLTVTANYRELELMWSAINYDIFTLDDKYSGRVLPEKYMFTSGLDSRFGYKNE